MTERKRLRKKMQKRKDGCKTLRRDRSRGEEKKT